MKYLANVTTLQYVSEKCTGCGRCVEVCPRSVFEMRTNGPQCGHGPLHDQLRKNCNSDRSVDSAWAAPRIINSMITGGPPSCDYGSGAGQLLRVSCRSVNFKR
jgi:Fe-S-cluster-containing hydrogenase component 2